MTDQTETTTKKQKPGLLRRVFWWLWVVLLSALLVLGLIFAAPWKAVMLIAIFLAAATILPRIYRKWFWAGVGVVIIVLVIWIFLPENNKGWRPYTFDKELAELQAKYTIPDSENAALVYEKLAETIVMDENEPNFFTMSSPSAKSGPWKTSEHPEMAELLQEKEWLMDKVINATKMERCTFPIISDMIIFRDSLKYFGPMRRWTYFLIAAGNNALAEGNTNDALEKYLAILRMGQHLSQQPNATDVLCGIAIESVGLGGINRFVIEWDANESYLNEAEQAVSKIRHDWNSDLPGFIEADKLMLKNMCGGLFYEINPKGKVRFSRDPLASIREMSDINTMCNDDKSGYWWKILFRAYIIPYWFYAPATPEKLSEIIDSSYEINYAMTKPDFDWSKEPQEVSIESLFQFKMNFRQYADLPARASEKLYFGLHDIYLRRLTEQRGALLIIAMRRYKNANGQWPQQLEDIKNYVSADTFIDPVNSGSFVYKRIEDNFMLYSKGENGIDEGGEFQSKLPPLGQPPEKPSPDDRKIWSKGKSAKTEREKTNAEQ